MRYRVPLIVLVCARLLSSHPALAQFSQQGPKLVGTDAVGSAGQGDSVSVSGDGNTAIVGGSGDGNDNRSGADLWILDGRFTKAARQESRDLTPIILRNGCTFAAFGKKSPSNGVMP